MNKKTITIEVSDYTEAVNTSRDAVAIMKEQEKNVTRKNVAVADSIKAQMETWFAETFNPLRGISSKDGSLTNRLLYDKYIEKRSDYHISGTICSPCFNSFRDNDQRFSIGITFFDGNHNNNKIYFKLDYDGKAEMDIVYPEKTLPMMIQLWDEFKFFCEYVASETLKAYEEEAQKKLYDAQKYENALAGFRV